MKKILFVAFATVQSLVLVGQIKTNEVQVENREDTKVETPLKIQADNINNIGVVEIDGIANTSQNNWVRGSILFSRDGDLDWDQSSLNWTLGGGGSNDFAAIIHDSSGDLRFFSGPPVVGGFSLSNADFRNTYEHLSILGNGNVGVGNTAPRYKLEVGAKVREKGSSADQDADILSNGGITISRNKLLTFDEGHKAHANMSYVSSGGEFRFKQQGYYGFNFVTRNDRSSLAIKGDDGFVGIGTTTPRYKLEVGTQVREKGSSADQDADILSNGGITISRGKLLTFDEGHKSHANMSYMSNGGEFRFTQQGYYGFNFVTRNDRSSLAIKGDDGFVGIGTQSPEEKLHVNGTTKVSSSLFWGGTGAVLGTDQGASIELRGNGIPFIDFSNDPSIDYDMRIILRGNDKMNIDGGNVGIGTNSPVEKLHVNGKIKTAANTWADFVFEETYELPDLEEVESHIDTHGHLKDIPAEAEILEEGYVLGDMDAKLLQKIEELTLYLIEQNKEIKELKAELKELKKTVSDE